MKGSEVMTLYNNRASIVHLDKDQVYVFKNIDNHIIMNYYTDKEIKEDTIIEDGLGEFDVLIKEEDKIDLIYQCKEQKLHLLTIDEDILDSIILTPKQIPKVFELNIKEKSQTRNIIYLVLKSNRDGIFQIHHYLLKDNKWTSFIVEEIKVDEVLNPIKLLEYGDNILLFYYQNNKISMKEFNFKENKWSDSIVLTDNEKKLYIDIIEKDNYFHLVYSQYKDDNLIIKYKRFLYSNKEMNEEIEKEISKKGNPSNPTLIIENNRLWVIWNESDRILSRYSNDEGLNWSHIYLWKESRYMDILRYKYITKDKDINIDYGFGTIYPDIKFLGFGRLNNVEIINPESNKFNINKEE